MRKLLKWIEAAFAATAFAEEGEAETARQVLAEADREDSPSGARSPKAAPRSDRRPVFRGGDKVARLP